jgi:hypothetical protein
MGSIAAIKHIYIYILCGRLLVPLLFSSKWLPPECMAVPMQVVVSHRSTECLYEQLNEG